MSELQLSDRTKRIHPSATLVIDALAKKLKAEGKPVISFAAGEPDFSTPSVIVDEALAAAKDNATHKYTPAAGLPGLRASVADFTNSAQKLPESARYGSDDVVITNGGKQAVFESLAAILNPGDDVLLPTPAWLTYAELINYYGAKTIKVLGQRENSYKTTVRDLEEAWTPKTTALILNSPSNPTGAVYSAVELQEIARFALEKKLWVISDEIYEYLIYGDLLQARQREGFETAPHILEVCPELKDQVIIINGVAKSSAMTGWRVGWMLGPPELVDAVKRLQSHLTSNVNNIAQRAALQAVVGDKTELFKMREAFSVRKNLIVDLLRQVKLPSGEGFLVSEPEGAFYAFVDVSAFINTPLKDGRTAQNATELASLLLEEVNVATIPMESFGIDNHLRFSYALSDSDIVEGVHRLIDFARNI